MNRSNKKEVQKMAEYINRDILIEQLANLVPFSIDDSNRQYQEGLNAAYDLICNAPAAKIRASATGKWIELDDCMTICPECNTLGCGTKYCANCGARLET